MGHGCLPSGIRCSQFFCHSPGSTRGGRRGRGEAEKLPHENRLQQRLRKAMGLLIMLSTCTWDGITGHRQPGVADGPTIALCAPQQRSPPHRTIPNWGASRPCASGGGGTVPICCAASGLLISAIPLLCAQPVSAPQRHMLSSAARGLFMLFLIELLAECRPTAGLPMQRPLPIVQGSGGTQSIPSSVPWFAASSRSGEPHTPLSSLPQAKHMHPALSLPWLYETCEPPGDWD